MFSITLERVLNLAVREAEVRRHAHLTLEHLLFAILHDPQGEEILRACGVDLERLRKELAAYLEESVERLPRGREQEPSQTLAFRRVLQAAVLHVQAAGKDEANVGDVLAAFFQQPRSHAVSLLQAQGVSRLDILNFVSHGVTKVPQPPRARRRRRAGGRARRGALRPRAGPALRLRREPDRAGAARRARPPDRPLPRDPARPRGALPPAQEQPGLRGRGRRGQDGPRGGARAAPPPGRRARDPEGRGDLRPRRGRAPGGHPFPRRLRGALQGPDGRALAPGQAHPLRGRAAHDGGGGGHDGRDHGPRQPREADPHRGQDPPHRLHHLRGVQVDREGPGPAPPAAEDRGGRAELRGHGGDPEGPALAIRGPPQGALHRPCPRGRGEAGGPPPARAQAAGQRGGRDRRGGSGHPPGRRTAARGRGEVPSPPAPRGGRGRDRAHHLAHGPHPREAGLALGEGAAEEPRRVAGAGSSSARKSRCERWPSRSSARAPASATPTTPPAASSSRDRPGSARPSSRSSSRSTWAASSTATT